MREWTAPVAVMVAGVALALAVAMVGGCAEDGTPVADAQPIVAAACLADASGCGQLGFHVQEIVGDGEPAPMEGVEFEMLDRTMQAVATGTTARDGRVAFFLRGGAYTVGMRTGDCRGGYIRPCVRRLFPEVVSPQDSQEQSVTVEYEPHCNPKNPECAQLDFDRVIKPNIYLYPEETTRVSVELEPLDPGALTVTIPEYGDGWDVTATPDGILDGEWTYLFYEADIVPRYQTQQGWSVSAEELEGWMLDILPRYGLNDREVADFVDYWMIHLPPFPYYLFFPQDDAVCDELVPLRVTPEPDSVLRIWFHVIGAYGPFDLAEPAIAPFERVGFTVTEWGILVNEYSFGL